jgi:hypothetical protein
MQTRVRMCRLHDGARRRWDDDRLP